MSVTRGGVTLSEIEAAWPRIAQLACRTPLRMSRALSRELGKSVFLKIETVQATGSFKLRGAANLILSLRPEERERGLVTCSAGNHGRAVAYVAERLGVRAVIFLSDRVPANKVQAIRELGAEVVVVGRSFDEAAERAEENQVNCRLIYVPAFDDPRIVAGAGTIGLENSLSFPLVRDYVDEIMLVTEEQIAATMAFALRRERLVLEGAGACGLALLREPRARALGDTVAVVCSGENVDIDVLLDIARIHPDF